MATVDEALDADWATVQAMTPAQISEQWRTAYDTQIRLELPRLITLLDDMRILETIQRHAASAEGKLPNARTAEESACLDAATFMRTANEYKRESANWGKARHRERLDALVSAGVVSAAQRQRLLDESHVRSVPGWQVLGLRKRPMLDEIQAALDRRAR